MFLGGIERVHWEQMGHSLKVIFPELKTAIVFYQSSFDTDKTSGGAIKEE